MQLKSILFFLIIGAVYLHESEATVKKLALVKAKVALVKAPHIIAKAAVAKEVKVKTKIALAKTGAAFKASKIAALSAITAPFRAAKKATLLKIGAAKGLAALKVAKVAKTATILKNLKKGPIILPVPVAVPLKSLPVVQPLAFPSLPTFNLPAPSLSDSLGPIQGFISGAQKAIQTAGSGIPFVSQLTKSFVPQIAKDVPVVTPAPVYRFVPEVGLPNFYKVNYQPKVEIEVPTVVSYDAPSAVYGPPVIPANTYGVPN